MITRSRFQNAWWLPGPHLQTVWPHLFRPAPPLKYTTERLYFPDGDFVDLAWNRISSGPTVCIFHGLQGSIESKYAAGLMHFLATKNIRAVLMHFRGCSGTPNNLARSYHSGDTGDIRFFLDTLRTREPHTPLAAVGFSLGGNALLKYLGEEGDAVHLSSAVAVSVPMVLSAAAERLQRGLSRLYQWHLLLALKEGVRAKADIVRIAGIDLSTAEACDTFWLFDDVVTAKLHGFADVHDYYKRASSRPFLKHINIPTLILQALDDPFLTPEVIPTESELSEQVVLEISESGGHVGFVGGAIPGRPFYWLETRIRDFFLTVPSMRFPS